MKAEDKTEDTSCRLSGAAASLTDLHMWGIDHKSASTEVRERAYLDSDRIRLFQEAFARETCGVASVVLCTCNRVELYLEVRGGCGARTALNEALDAAGVDGRLFFGKHGVHLNGFEVAGHLYRLCAGLESMVLGENEILGQVKRAYRMAEENHDQLGSVLNKTFQGAFRAAKRARSRTAISAGAVSLSSAAVDEARRRVGDFQGLDALLVGAGKIGSLAAGRLIDGGIGRLTILNRSLDRANGLAIRVRDGKRRDVIAGPLSDLESSLVEADIAITATGSPEPIITKDLLSGLRARRAGRPLHIFDIAVPRDVHPDVGDLDYVTLTGIDELSDLVGRQMANRVNEVPAAERIIGEELEELYEWRDSLRVKPAVIEFRSYLESLAKKEMGHIRREQPPDTAEAIENSLRKFVGRLLQRPARRLRTAVSDSERNQDIRSLMRLFELRDDATASQKTKG